MSTRSSGGPDSLSGSAGATSRSGASGRLWGIGGPGSATVVPEDGGLPPQQIYRKLGVRSRTQLAAQLSRETTTPHRG